MDWRFTTTGLLRILYMITSKNTGDDGQHTTSLMPTPSMPILIYGTAQHSKDNSIE